MYGTEIKKVTAREILDSRGNPTVEAEITLSNGIKAAGISPSGASTGEFEALELRDMDMLRYDGKGVLNAVDNVNTIINDALCGINVDNIYDVDKMLILADGTFDKHKLGANAILAVSIAAAKAACASLNIPLYRYLGGISSNMLPIPMMNIINGGVHAANSLDIQEFMIVPYNAKSYHEALHMGTRVYHCLKNVLVTEGLSTAVGDEGGFAPEIADTKEALDLICKAIRVAGFNPGENISIALDAAASEWKMPPDAANMRECHSYYLTKAKRSCTSQELIAMYKSLIDKYPIISIEDPLGENDWEGWKCITKELGKQIMLVGDDLFVTNKKRLQRGITEKCGNAILIKLNQIGTVSETIETIKAAQNAGYRVIVSHRSGETEDTTIADLAVALNAGFIKAGAPCRGERIAKYNRLLRIEEEIRQYSLFNSVKESHAYK